MTDTKREVRDFYDGIGWQQEDNGLYQNARYEDLRPVSREYVHQAHLRVNQYLPESGKFLLDAGSGPVQWPEYLTYSRNFNYHLCADLSITALKEARTRLDKRGLYVVSDITRLPFRPDVIDSVVSLHAIHHLPLAEHRNAYTELHRVVKPGGLLVIVNGWYRPLLARLTRPFVQLRRLISGRPLLEAPGTRKYLDSDEDQAGTFVNKMTPRWFKREFKGVFNYKIRVWRSLSPRILINFIHPKFGGKTILKMVFWLEEKFPVLFGTIGVYPLIVFKKD